MKSMDDLSFNFGTQLVDSHMYIHIYIYTYMMIHDLYLFAFLIHFDPFDPFDP